MKTKTYQDSEQGCKELIRDHMEENAIDPDIFYPDPNVRDVWLAIDSKKKRAVIVYLVDNDLEEIEYIGDMPREYLSKAYQ